ncbi:MAG: potassium channel family protein [Candidatus Methanoperedens sp.]|nr:potassium channel family protein [Candidatus Methanoperedens sp.]
MAVKWQYLYLKEKRSPLGMVVIRLMLVLTFILVLAFILWVLENYIDPGGILDSNDPTGVFSFADSIYFTMVTVMTVGYGDIVPVSSLARMLDAFLITPGRIFVWLILFGTAYEFVYQQYREEMELKKLQKKLNNHIIICGYGMTGQAVVDELINKKYDTEQIVVIDNDEESIRYAADNNITAILGSASKENILKKAAIEKAETIIITTGRDDTNVLICLSAKNLNPKITIISRANEIENKKLLRQSGADYIISPSITGGRLMVLAIKNKLSTKLLDDLLTSRYGVDVNEREITAEEIGKKPKDVQGIVVVEVNRGDTKYQASELGSTTLEKGDWIVFIEKVI